MREDKSIVKDGKLWGLHCDVTTAEPKLMWPIRCASPAKYWRVFSPSHIAMAEEEDARAQIAALFALTARIEERMRKDRDVVGRFLWLVTTSRQGR